MSNAIKLSLVLFLVLVIVSYTFYNGNKKINEKIKDVDGLFSAVKVELMKPEYIVLNINTDIDSMNITYMRSKLLYYESWAKENSKFFLNQDDSKTSWAYFQDITKQFNANFPMEFSMDAKEENKYNVSGDARIADFNSFINYMEKLEALYTIETATIHPNFHETENGPMNTIIFSLNIKAHVDAPRGRKLDENLRKIAFNTLPKDPFRPAIHDPMEDPNQEKYIKYDDIKFVSFTHDQAFFLDANNHVIVLKQNQPVAYGYFSHVDNRNRAVFRINRTGLYETIYKNLEKG
jgi:hypothetical protein